MLLQGKILLYKENLCYTLDKNYKVFSGIVHLRL